MTKKTKKTDDSYSGDVNNPDKVSRNDDNNNSDHDDNFYYDKKSDHEDVVNKNDKNKKKSKNVKEKLNKNNDQKNQNEINNKDNDKDINNKDNKNSKKYLEAIKSQYNPDYVDDIEKNDDDDNNDDNDDKEEPWNPYAGSDPLGVPYTVRTILNPDTNPDPDKRTPVQSYFPFGPKNEIKNEKEKSNENENKVSDKMYKDYIENEVQDQGYDYSMGEFDEGN